MKKRSEDVQAIVDELKRSLRSIRSLFKRLKEMVREGKIKDPTNVERQLSSMRNAIHSIGRFIVVRERHASRKPRRVT